MEWYGQQLNRQLEKENVELKNKIGKYELNNTFIIKYKSIAFAANENKISKSSISGVLMGKRKTAGGFIWKYLD